MGYLYLLAFCTAREVNQIMEPDITSRTASMVVTIIDSDPDIRAMATRTANNTLQQHRHPGLSNARLNQGDKAFSTQD